VVADQRVRVLSVPLVLDGQIVGVAQAASSLQVTDRLMANLARTLLTMLPLALLVTAATGIYLTRHALKPVQAIARAAGRIEATSLSGRLPVNGQDEFAELAGTFNSMLARLEASFLQLEQANEAQRRFISDASHELKTPLTAIKTRSGVARRGPQTPERYQEHLMAIGVSADAMAAIVQDLLLLAKSDEGKLNLNLQSVPLAAITEEAAILVRAAGKAPLKIDVPLDLDVVVDQALFGRVLVNLLDNALRHTPPTGEVRLSAQSRENGFTVRIVDTGEGMPAEHLPHIFERFHRVHAARDRETGGTGLGLAIAKSIVEAHRGTIAINSQAGSGTTIVIEVPALYCG
jgi:heavy metal sensor kinase